MSMTTNKKALRALATALDADDWHAEGNSVYGGAYDVGDNVCYDHIASCESVNGESPHADFIAAANPAVMLALLDELEAAERRNAEKRTINVKLPADYYSEDGSVNDDMVNTCAVVEAFRDALSAAGISIAAATDKGE